ncbi:bifunctional proline dehydrogenase/L-glutamate gamma-semialdehyde dehydrogenase PutA [Teredinibacter sp. KSP-S5-2]|uniref:bifunctional proline dehydrogenase/L-glutamate gamma-semialdehyde dehydrogenase PutA n=1 Tax=Teredinibacter sp. KSP-S5-2 TaxID=3034506 RepID=UPI0029348EB1|nr:bifunctional proline dehydrogenase/L-glutamate gamma-semialdehyde dehydrogenase PutA [Teredinibacter sp. KSP-S5-2]WNO07630.1 bifunctional proline dehydrogenase/L-glutamate gamma-semialdehyde dehydrogenase PutA [Teredinibacter sp. KSP-S5-2]
MPSIQELYTASGDAFSLDDIKASIRASYLLSEPSLVHELKGMLIDGAAKLESIQDDARHFVNTVRSDSSVNSSFNQVLQHFSLSNEEGLALMCLSEALLRIPDNQTRIELIKDQLSKGDWQKFILDNDHYAFRVGVWGLILTGKYIKLGSSTARGLKENIVQLLHKYGDPVMAKAVSMTMAVMSKHFVMGESLEEALKNAQLKDGSQYLYSFDMLGEAALSKKMGERYKNTYISSIKTIGKEKSVNHRGVMPSVSIKLSALHPRYEYQKGNRVLQELSDSVLEIAICAKQYDVSLTIDAEEADRLEISLDIFQRVYASDVMCGWGKLGLAVQAYSKRALPVLAWINALAHQQGDEIPVRLVKGAYWDYEIKRCQQQGLSDYSVFTEKAATDICYQVCAQYLLSPLTRGNIYPQFATHNAYTIAYIQHISEGREYEFQRLHGMGESLYDEVLKRYSAPVRIYAPIGPVNELLPYLVRRLLENGANNSFVNQLLDQKVTVDELVSVPEISERDGDSELNIPLPEDIFQPIRKNSSGLNLSISEQSEKLLNSVAEFENKIWHAGSIVNGVMQNNGEVIVIHPPFDPAKKIGEVHWANQSDIEDAVQTAYEYYPIWRDTDVEKRAQYIDTLADLMGQHRDEFIALCAYEAGKTLQDGIDEVREAIDFCRYYAGQAREKFSRSLSLKSPVGESNELLLQGKGLFLCISPWNFPLAIFTGQIVAALLSGNTVVAKPAEQTNLIAAKWVTLAHLSGVPKQALQLLLGDGESLGGALVQDARFAGVCFTGSTDTAKLIQKTLANRPGSIATFVAETGGQNAMIADSTCLPEQLVKDIISSAFYSAGQRCSACRVLYVQEDIADQVFMLLSGAMQELTLGDPSQLETDIGPVIDDEAKNALQDHILHMQSTAKIISQSPLPDYLNGFFIPPLVVEIQSIQQLDKEHFGPILHVIRFHRSELENVIRDINQTGYGLTLGIHTRNQHLAEYISAKVNVGNVYINRNQVGAVVGVQPFGGRGLSGTGPKAGGPNYLMRFVTEKVITRNTSAIGGSVELYQNNK